MIGGGGVLSDGAVLRRRVSAEQGAGAHVSIPIPAVAMSSPCGDSSGPALRPLGRRPNYSRRRVWPVGRSSGASRTRTVHIAAAPDGGNRGCLNSLSRQPGSDTAQDFAKTFELLRFSWLRHARDDGGKRVCKYENVSANSETNNARRS